MLIVHSLLHWKDVYVERRGSLAFLGKLDLGKIQFLLKSLIKLYIQTVI